MLFNSGEFVLFFAFVLGFYWTLPLRGQNRLLLLASYFFYGFWDYRFLSLLLISTTIDYGVGLAIAATRNRRRRRALVTVSVLSNLTILGFFKYFDFFVEGLRTLAGSVGVDLSPATLSIILPVGISFYTFQSMTYSIDIHRGRLKPTRRFEDFALFVAFFPQLVAGPIERATRLLPQIQRPRRSSWDDVGEGTTLFLLGLFKKVVVADGLAAYADRAFAAPGDAGSGALLFGIYCFSFQIYADFSGYSDMARGLARLLGFRLTENFDQPYFSTSITEFWRRWHITLSGWLRDYLYIPLGGNRGGAWLTYRNLFLTMLLGGLWHGAAWTFVVWGALHGTYLAAHRRFRAAAPPPPGSIRFAFQGLLVFHLVALTWVFFRAPSFGLAWEYLVGLVTLQGAGAISFGPPEIFHFVVVVGLLLLCLDVHQYRERSHTVILRWSVPRRAAVLSILTLALITSATSAPAPFIYFQF